MSDVIYYCTQENNTCPKKDECERYICAEGKNHATLFKMACIDINNYVLFIKSEENNDKGDNNEQE